MKTATASNPIITEIVPARIEAAPRLGPTVRSSTICTGAGSAPDFSTVTMSSASWRVTPSISVRPPGIRSRMLG